MKKQLILLMPLAVLTLFSCKKEYEDKVGSFTGTETRIEGNYDDTLVYDQFSAIYTLAYDKKAETYSLTSNTGKFPAVSFKRAEFEDNKANGAGGFFSFAQWNTTYYPETNELIAEYEYLASEEWRVATFQGTKN